MTAAGTNPRASRQIKIDGEAMQAQRDAAMRELEDQAITKGERKLDQS